MFPATKPVKAFETAIEVVSPPAIVPLLAGLTSVGLLISEFNEY